MCKKNRNKWKSWTTNKIYLKVKTEEDSNYLSLSQNAVSHLGIAYDRWASSMQSLLLLFIRNFSRHIFSISFWCRRIVCLCLATQCSSLSRTFVYCLYNKRADWHTAARKHKQMRALVGCYGLRLAHITRTRLARTIHAFNDAAAAHTCSTLMPVWQFACCHFTSQSIINGVDKRIAWAIFAFAREQRIDRKVY